MSALANAVGSLLLYGVAEKCLPDASVGQGVVPLTAGLDSAIPGWKSGTMGKAPDRGTNTSLTEPTSSYVFQRAMPASVSRGKQRNRL